MHVDAKHLPKLQYRDRVLRKRYLHVAIDPATRSVHLAVKDDESAASAIAFLAEALEAFPFRVPHVLTDRGSCFAADAFEAALRPARHAAPQDQALSAEDQRYGRALQRSGPARGPGASARVLVQREGLGITLYSHADPETVLRGFNVADNRRRQRVLDGLSPEMVLRQRLEAEPARANPTFKPPGPGLIRKALRVVEDAKEVSHPDSLLGLSCHSRNILKAGMVKLSPWEVPESNLLPVRSPWTPRAGSSSVRPD